MNFVKSWRQFLNEADDVDPHAITKVQKPKTSEYETDEYASSYEYEETPEKSRETYFGKSPEK